MIVEIIAFIPLAVWCYLAIGHGGFWRCAERDGAERPLSRSPRVGIVIPARDEAACIGRCLESLFGQDYGGESPLSRSAQRQKPPWPIKR